MAQAIPAIVAVIGTVISTVSQIQQTRGAAAQHKANADAIKAQRDMATAEARQETERVLSKQRALAAASGVDSTSGSSLEQALDTAFTGEMNALKTRYRYEVQRQSEKSQAAAAKSRIPGMIIGGVTSAARQAAASYFGGGFGGLGGATAGAGTAGSSLGGGFAGGASQWGGLLGQSSLLTDWMKTNRGFSLN